MLKDTNLFAKQWPVTSPTVLGTQMRRGSRSPLHQPPGYTSPQALGSVSGSPFPPETPRYSVSNDRGHAPGSCT